MKKLIPVTILLLITYSLTLIEAPLKKINETKTGDYVKLRGEVIEAFKPKRITILNLSDGTGSIKVIFFDKVTAWKGMKAEIKGRVTYYNHEKELKGVRIKNLS
ncbi:hypothetical protein GF352_03455 [archaeon]|nr:hypothetical protein [archaeon]